MRATALAITALLLAGCDSNDVPSPAERLEGEVVAPVDEGKVSLRADGLSAGAESFFFAAGETEVQSALAASLGEDGEVIAIDECGAGPMTFANYSGNLSVNFQDGNLVGWSLSEAHESVAYDGGVAIGMARETVEAIPGFAVIEDSTLGDEFIVGGEIAGFFEEGKVSMLYAGTQCFFR